MNKHFANGFVVRPGDDTFSPRPFDHGDSNPTEEKKKKRKKGTSSVILLRDWYTTMLL